MKSLREEVRSNFPKYTARMTPKQEAVIKLWAKGIMGIDIAKELDMLSPSVYRIIKKFLDNYQLSHSNK
jgi:DNA-binding NarL/FixJ family response regulator